MIEPLFDIKGLFGLMPCHEQLCSESLQRTVRARLARPKEKIAPRLAYRSPGLVSDGRARRRQRIATRQRIGASERGRRCASHTEQCRAIFDLWRGFFFKPSDQRMPARLDQRKLTAREAVAAPRPVARGPVWSARPPFRRLVPARHGVYTGSLHRSAGSELGDLAPS